MQTLCLPMLGCAQGRSRPPVRETQALLRRGSAMQDKPMHSTCRWSVPQHPPSTLICGKRRRRSLYWAPSSTGLPMSNSGELSSSAWLRLEEFARRPRKRFIHLALLSRT